MAHFVGEASTQGPVVLLDAPCGGDLSGALPEMEWEDVDAFLDDYLKELGPEAHGPDHFGNFGIDFAPSVALQAGVMGAWGPSAPAPPAPTDSTQHPAATILTSQLRAQALDSQGPAEGEAVQQPARATRARKGAAAAPAGGGGRAASGASRGGKESRKELDIKKHLALQEKNRRAQRRFRERQKQRVAELEEQVAALQAQLAGAATACGGTAPLALPSGSDSMQQDGKREQLPSPRAVVGAQLPASSSQPGSDEEQLQVAFEEALTLTVREAHPVQLSTRQLAEMTPAELARHYKAYVNELAGILVESDNPGSHATQERVRRLVGEVCLLYTRTALCNPAGSKHFTLTKVDDVSNQPADTRVPQIARALDISHHQRRQLGQLRGLLLQKLARIAAERQDINQQLAGAVPGGTGNRHLAARYLAAHDGARRLRESLRQEHVLLLDFVSTIFKHVLSSQQAAQFMIQCYPWTPDCLALCTWVAAEDGDAEALSQLAAEAQCKQAAAAAAQAASNGGAPQASGGSGSGAAAAPAGGSAVLTPTSGAGLPSAAGGAMFAPGSFGGAPQHPMFGQPLLAPFGAAPPLAHPPDAMHGLLGPQWGSGGVAPGSSAQSAAPLPAALPMLPPTSSGCLPVPLGLPHLAGGGKGGLLAELGGLGLPLSPHMAALSSATNA